MQKEFVRVVQQYNRLPHKELARIIQRGPMILC